MTGQRVFFSEGKITMKTRWTEEQANDWYASKPWLLGCNFTPRNAINQLEMWQKETFSPKLIDQELKWASDIGFNSMRVFLHNLPWQDDAAGFRSRIDRFLGIAAKRKIGAMLVIFDSCWHPFPRLGKQRDPEPHIHNSGWVQSPGRPVLEDAKRFAKLKRYVVDVMSHFRDDPRIHCWDLWNEPGNTNDGSYGVREFAGKLKADETYLPQVFDWARSANPTQPITAGVWHGNWETDEALSPLDRTCLTQSDIISFHCYGKPEKLERVIGHLARFDRPKLCTEYMSRTTGSTFTDCLPILKKHHIAAYNWGFVAGKTQTNYPWNSWQSQYDAEPKLWLHDVLRPDGTPYKSAEAKLIKKLTRGNVAKSR